jgi:hypothetical protein
MADLDTALPVNGPKVTRLFQGLAACPHCNANLIASEIPAESRRYYMTPGKEHDRPLYFYRLIGQSSMLFDRVLAWTCPDCKVTDVIPGCEEMWEKDQAYWAEYEARQAHQYRPMPDQQAEQDTMMAGKGIPPLDSIKPTLARA